MIKITLQIAMPLEIIEKYRKFSLKQLDVDPNISGYFKLEMDSFVFGFAQDKPMEAHEQGWDIPAIWLEHLLVVSREIVAKEYVAIANTETSNVYLEFSLEKNKQIRIREICAENSDWVLYKRPEKTEIMKTSNTTIHLNEFKKEVLTKKYQFLRDISRINPLFFKTNEFNEDQTYNLRSVDIIARDFIVDGVNQYIPELYPVLQSEIEYWGEDYISKCGGHTLIGDTLAPFLRDAIEHRQSNRLECIKAFFEIFSKKAKFDSTVEDIWGVAILELLYDIESKYKISFLGPNAGSDYQEYREMRKNLNHL